MEESHMSGKLTRTEPSTFTWCLTAHGVEFKVSHEDADLVAAHRWTAYRHPQTFYVARKVRNEDGSHTTEYLHCAIMARKLGRSLTRRDRVDHENGDGLDNRRDMIRLATCSQNLRNRCHRNPNASSRYLGVHWYARKEKWQAQIRGNTARVHLGYYTTELAAALARESYILAHPDLMARSNFEIQPTK